MPILHPAFNQRRALFIHNEACNLLNDVRTNDCGNNRRGNEETPKQLSADLL